MFVVAIYFLIDAMLIYFFFIPDPADAALVIDFEETVASLNKAFSEVEMTDKSVESSNGEESNHSRTIA